MTVMLVSPAMAVPFDFGLRPGGLSISASGRGLSVIGVEDFSEPHGQDKREGLSTRGPT
jgi:hypothetical protein